MEVTIDDLLDALAAIGVGSGSHRQHPSVFGPDNAAAVQALALVAIAERLEAIYQAYDDSH
jgi:hypothetical protein